MGKMGHFGPKITTFKLFSKHGHQIFLKLYLMIDIKKWVKVLDSTVGTGGPLLLHTCFLVL